MITNTYFIAVIIYYLAQLWHHSTTHLKILAGDGSLKNSMFTYILYLQRFAKFQFLLKMLLFAMPSVCCEIENWTKETSCKREVQTAEQEEIRCLSQ